MRALVLLITLVTFSWLDSIKVLTLFLCSYEPLIYIIFLEPVVCL